MSLFKLLEFKLNKLVALHISLTETLIASIDFNDILRIDLKSDIVDKSLV